MTQLIVALDTELERAKAIVDELGAEVGFYKVGYKLFLRHGIDILSFLRERNKKIFLDLKFYDIPNTMANAAKECADLGIDMFNIHVAAGREAVDAMLKAMPEDRPFLIGVTVLTSRDAKAGEVESLAESAKEWGLDGVVCSVGEARAIKERVGNDFLCVCPGVRLNKEGVDDQRRVYTPIEARDAGADFIVVGRPIVMAQLPLDIARRINSELN